MRRNGLAPAALWSISCLVPSTALAFDEPFPPLTSWPLQSLFPFHMQPNGIETDAAGDVYVLGLGEVHVYDRYGSRKRRWFGSLDWAFPTGIAVDTTGDVFVVESFRDRVDRFAADGTLITQWGQTGSGAGDFDQPVQLDVSASGSVYVADQGNARVQVFDTNGTYLFQWGVAGTADGQFEGITDLVVAANGNVYVSDLHRVQIFDPLGNYLATIGSAGTGPGEFEKTTHMDLDAQGNLLVGDLPLGSSRIQRFDSSGTFVDGWPESGIDGLALNSEGTIYYRVAGTYDGVDASGHSPMALVLDVPVVAESDRVDLRSFSGQPNAPLALYLFEISGNPFVQRLLVARYSSTGHWGAYGTLPPGLSGQSFTFDLFSFDAAGKVILAEEPAVLTVE